MSKDISNKQVKFFLYIGPKKLISPCLSGNSKKRKNKRHSGCAYGCLGRVKDVCPFCGDGSINERFINYFKIIKIPKYRADILDKLVATRS